MLFDEAPKSKRSDLFDCDQQLSEFTKSIKEGAFVAKGEDGLYVIADPVLAHAIGSGSLR